MPAAIRLAPLPHRTAWAATAALAVTVSPAPADSFPNPEQSVLHPASADARGVTDLFWIMTGAGAVIWALVLGITVYAVLARNKPTSEEFADRFILIAGVIFPSVTLALLLVIGLGLLPDWREGDAPDLRVHVVGEQFWWRLVYELPDGTRVETANDLHLPVGAEVEFVLTAQDVIHSFWIPALGGKLDMIPGRTTVLRLRPNRTGQFRGVCAEFCGLSHAMMAFRVDVTSAEDFADWLRTEAAPAAVRAADPAYVAAGCPACHVIRGVPGGTPVGPDLTHFANRAMMAAGTVPLTPANLADWITSPETLKPDARMPGFAHLPEAERSAITDFLLRLQ